jgi:hypothetical protein
MEANMFLEAGHFRPTTKDYPVYKRLTRAQRRVFLINNALKCQLCGLKLISRRMTGAKTHLRDLKESRWLSEQMVRCSLLIASYLKMSEVDLQILIDVVWDENKLGNGEKDESGLFTVSPLYGIMLASIRNEVCQLLVELMPCDLGRPLNIKRCQSTTNLLLVGSITALMCLGVSQEMYISDIKKERPK